MRRSRQHGRASNPPRRRVVALGAALLTLIFAGMSAAPSGASEPTPGGTFDMKPGETLVVTEDDGTLEVTVKSISTRTSACLDYGSAPTSGSYVVADVTVSVVSGTASINPLYLTWVADDGTTTDSIGGTFSGCDPALDSGNDMPSGTKRRGNVVFDVNANGGALTYENVLGTPLGSWRPE